jgi:hypothetical protein
VFTYVEAPNERRNMKSFHDDWDNMIVQTNLNATVKGDFDTLLSWMVNCSM